MAIVSSLRSTATRGCSMCWDSLSGSGRSGNESHSTAGGEGAILVGTEITSSSSAFSLADVTCLFDFKGFFAFFFGFPAAGGVSCAYCGWAVSKSSKSSCMGSSAEGIRYEHAWITCAWRRESPALFVLEIEDLLAQGRQQTRCQCRSVIDVLGRRVRVIRCMRDRSP